LKSQEELKFIPINMHLEHFIVESKYDKGPKKKSCYDFTSVGAFTTVHVEKTRQASSVEALMHNESPLYNIPFLIKNEVTLVFYSLKIFNNILSDMLLISGTDDKIKVNIKHFAKLINRCV
jgi:hypothetical protein